jgi:hypothetical protein
MTMRHPTRSEERCCAPSRDRRTSYPDLSHQVNPQPRPAYASPAEWPAWTDRIVLRDEEMTPAEWPAFVDRWTIEDGPALPLFNTEAKGGAA